MAFGVGFGSLVGGFVDGANIRHAWDDRKDAKARQKVLDGYEAERQKRLGEMHGWDAETHDWNRGRFGMEQGRYGVEMANAEREGRAWERAWEDDTAMREAFDAANAAAEAGMGPAPRGLPPGFASAPAPAIAAPAAPPPAGPAERAAMEGTPYITPMGASGRPWGITPGVATGAAGQFPRGYSGMQQQPAPGYTPQPGADQVHVGIEQRDYPFSPSYSDPGSMRTLGTPGEGHMLPSERPSERALAERARERAGVPEEAAQVGAPDDRARGIAEILERRDSGLPDIGGRGAFTEDMAELAKLPARGAVRVADAIHNQGARGVRQIAAPINSLSRWITGEDAVGMPENVDSLETGRRKPGNGFDIPAAAAKPPTTPEGKPMQESQAEASRAASGVMETVVAETPGMAEAAEAVTRGLGAGDRLTPAQRTRGAQTFMQSYRDNGAPMVIKQMMRQGRFGEAEALQTFVDSAATREGMDAWAGAVFAAQQGDIESAVDGIITAYNSNGYFNDGYEVDREKTQLIRADDGEVMGIRMVVRDQNTGEESVMEDSIPGLIEKGLWVMSPQKAAENYLDRQAAVRTRMLELEDERRAAEVDINSEDHKQTLMAAREAFKALSDPLNPRLDADGKPLPPPSWPDFLREFMADNAAMPDLGLTDVPVMRR